MKKKIISLYVISIIALTPLLCFADENYTTIEPVIQTIPVNNQNSSYQTQYPLPVNNYQNNTYQTQYPLPANNYQYQGYRNDEQNSKLQGTVVMVPAGISFPATLMTPLSTNSSQLGDNVTFYLNSDFYYGNNLIAGAGSRVNGTVIVCRKGGVANRQGKLQVRFTNITTPSGQIIPINASIETNDGTGILKAGTTKDVAKEYVKDAAIGAAAGAILGTALGALSDGSVGRGAIYGTAVGGGMGLIQNVFVKGEDIDIPQNAQMNIILEQPVTVSSNTPY